MKRAQMQHMFTFLLVGIVLLFTIILGTKFLLLLSDRGCETQQAQVIDALEEMEITHATFGTKQTVRLQGACNIQYICMIAQEFDPTTQAGVAQMQTLPISDSVAAQLRLAAQRPSPKQNIFAVDDDTITELTVLRKFSPEQGVLCFPSANGHFIFQVEGRGRDIIVREVS